MNKLDDIKKELKERVYYNPNSGNVIQDVAKVFNIPVGENDSNLTITSFNYSVPDVTMYDVMEDITYHGTFSNELPFFNYTSKEKEFLKVQISYWRDNLTLDRYYDLDNNLLLERIRCSLGNEEFTLDRIHDSRYDNISYSEKLRLFQKDNSFGESIIKTDEESVYCFDTFSYEDGNDEENRYVVKDLHDGSLTYGINGLSLVDENLSIKGVCIENASDIKKKRLPLGMRTDGYDGFSAPCINSLLVFEGYDNNVGKSLEVIKYPFYISMKYTKKGKEGAKEETKELCFSNLEDNNIGESELDMLASRLDSDFSEDRFISLVKREVLGFKDEIGLPWINEDTIFAARALDLKTTDEIVSLVLHQKNDCFDSMRKRLYDGYHISEAISRESNGSNAKINKLIKK